MNTVWEAKVLLADDDPDMLSLLLHRLGRAGIRPDRAPDGETAKALVRENLYDLIVTDIYMPGATGLELLELAIERDPQVRVVVMTGASTLENAIEAVNKGAFAYLTKPFDHLTVFDNAVYRALESRRLILDNLELAEMQQRRGDMLEGEVARRIEEIQHWQFQINQLLGSLPVGIIILDRQGTVHMSNPLAERWLAWELRPEEDIPGQLWASVNGQSDGRPTEVKIGAMRLLVTAVDLADGDRRAFLLQEAAGEQPAPSPSWAEPLGNLRRGLAWLSQRPLQSNEQLALRYLAHHAAELERALRATSAERIGLLARLPGASQAALAAGHRVDRQVAAA